MGRRWKNLKSWWKIWWKIWGWSEMIKNRNLRGIWGASMWRGSEWKIDSNLNIGIVRTIGKKWGYDSNLKDREEVRKCAVECGKSRRGWGVWRNRLRVWSTDWREEGVRYDRLPVWTDQVWLKVKHWGSGDVKEWFRRLVKNWREKRWGMWRCNSKSSPGKVMLIKSNGI